ncbi:MAG: aspartate aminotransferase family protein [Acetobacteraceae bacterium]|nr:aspartate aminotransferase family protein [Acetobacteraceae bacterium]
MSRLLHRSVAAAPPLASRGQGIHLFDAAGRAVIDGSGGAAVACLGHGHPKVLEAIRAQLDRLAYAHTSFFSTEPAEALAEALVGDSPGGLTHAWFCSSGSEATEAALKLARLWAIERGEPERHHVIARHFSYHGNTLGALAASGNLARRAPYLPLLSPAFRHVSRCHPWRDKRVEEDDAAYVARLAAELDATIRALGPGRVLAFVAETVVGATLGCVPPAPGYLAAIRRVCDRHGVLLILDEVMCGLGRCGSRHAWQAEGVAPDIQVVAKGLAGGTQPIGGILVAGHVVEALRVGSGLFRHGHTYQAHPVACAAALAVQRVIAEEGLVERAAQLGALLRAALEERLGRHPHVGDIRGRGLFQAAEFVADRTTKTPFAPARAVHAAIGRAALARGLACYPMAGAADGIAGDHAILAPPFIATEAEIVEIADRFAGAVRDVLG